ncbi:MAG: purine-nucleoside phosphorylase [Gemmatimonadetes bacterium]|nr:purine-nucleoside phosphorylase [Gemmatimonadota bacterium]
MTTPDPVRVAADLRARLGAPRLGLILGSGLGALADEFSAAVRVPYDEIPGFSTASVAGHAGALVSGTLEGVSCVALQGRAHLYEGHRADEVAFPARVLIALGVRGLIVTNAAGGINPRFRPGDLMLIDDHINFLWQNPLIGPVRDGEQRFPDMSRPYDRDWQQLAERCALDEKVRLVRGVYIAVLGPSYETRAEIGMFRRVGADAVGMSTVPEVLVARTAGVRVLGVSLITNPAADLSPTPLDHAEVIAAGEAARLDFSRLLRRIIREAAPELV